jgi:hypothetical protein
MGSFNFVIGADTRLDSAWSCMEQNKKDWKLNLNKAIYAIDKINNLTPRPQFVVICGNFVNEMPNSKLNFHIKYYIYITFIFFMLRVKRELPTILGQNSIFRLLPGQT